MRKVSIFEADIVEMMRNEMEDLNFDTSSITDPLELMQTYFSMARRLVPIRKYEVKEAKGFVVPDEVKEGYDQLKEKLKKGEDVIAHLHKAIDRVNGKDAMLFDWGIHHFHLGTTIEADGFVTRTGPVLYAVVKDNTIYAITINQHGHWSDKEMLEAINENWPELLDGYLLPGNYNPEFIPTNEDIKELRRLNVNLFIQLSDGKSVMGRGGGLAGDGSSAECIRYALDLRNGLDKVEDKIEKQLEEINEGLPDGMQYKIEDLNVFYREEDEICVKTEDGAIKTTLLGLPSLKKWLNV